MNYWRGSRVTTNFSSITHPPVLDGSTGKVHFFGISLGAGSPQVVQTDTALGSVVTATVGNANSPQVHAGTFDNAYFTSTGGTGYLYVCGHDNASTNHPTLYRIHLASGVMSNTNDGSSLSLGTGTGACSPLSEIYNSGQSTGTDWLFVGIPGNCAFSGSSTVCVESFNITSGFPATAAATGSTSGGTSGIVVDNVSTSGHASSLYYSTLSTATCTSASGTSSSGGCAVQRTQSGLQ